MKPKAKKKRADWRLCIAELRYEASLFKRLASKGTFHKEIYKGMYVAFQDAARIVAKYSKVKGKG